jgi:hypothetical protein
MEGEISLPYHITESRLKALDPTDERIMRLGVVAGLVIIVPEATADG